MQRRKFLAGAAAAASVPLIGCATEERTAAAQSAAAKQAMLASAAGAGLLFTATPGEDLYGLFASANAVNGTVYFPIQVGDHLGEAGTIGVLVEPSGGVRPEDVKITEGNFLQGVTYSEASKANIYRNNRMDGFQRAAPLSAMELDHFEANAGGLVTCYHGPVSVDAGAPNVTVALPINGNYPSYFRVRAHAYQYDGGLSRGRVRAHNDYAGGVLIEFDTAFGLTIADIWLDVEVF